MIKNKLKLTLNTVALLVIATLTINTVSAQLHVAKKGGAVTEDGNVGIGTDTPTEKLDVDGNILVRQGRINVGTNGGNESVLQLGYGRTKDGNSRIDFQVKPEGPISAQFISDAESGPNKDLTTSSFQHHGDGVFNLRTMDPSSFIQFITAAENKKPILAFTIRGKNGFIGIKQQNPTAELEVRGDAKKSEGGGEWDTTSDKRTKKNINQYEAGLADVLKLNPVTFNYNGKAGITNTETTHIGLIAQEFAKIEPSGVKTFKHTEEGSNKTEEYLSLNASSVKYMLVNAVKEQQALIETQKAELETLKETVAKLATNSSPVTTPGATEISVLLEGNGSESALLAQNTPNPFTTKTRIEYFIPENSRNARMSFRDMTGKEIKRIDLTHDGIGAIELSAKDLSTGIYSYVLYVNGSIVASKKMILTQ